MHKIRQSPGPENYLRTSELKTKERLQMDLGSSPQEGVAFDASKDDLCINHLTMLLAQHEIPNASRMVCTFFLPTLMFSFSHAIKTVTC